MFNVPTVTIKHKRKGWRLVVNATDWAQDLGLVRWRDYERVNESHNDSGEVLVVNTEPAPEVSDLAAAKKLLDEKPIPTQDRKVEPAEDQHQLPEKPAPKPRRAALSRRTKTPT